MISISNRSLLSCSQHLDKGGSGVKTMSEAVVFPQKDFFFKIRNAIFNITYLISLYFKKKILKLLFSGLFFFTIFSHNDLAAPCTV